MQLNRNEDIDRSNQEPYMLKTYKQRRNEFKKSFKDTKAETSLLISDYSCAILAGTPKILQQGRMYITTEFVCFSSRFLTFEQKIIIGFQDIIDISKEKTARVFPNAIQITNLINEKMFFSSFTTRDRTYDIIRKLWTEYKEGYKIPSAAFWDRVRENYGNDLGFVLDDPELNSSSATQFIAHYKITRRPSELIYSSQDDSFYESVEDSPLSDCLINDSSFDGEVTEIKPIKTTLNNKADEEIKFNIHFKSSKTNKTKPKSLEISENVIPAATCSEHEHFPINLLDEEFNINVAVLWSFIFTDHAFFRAFSAMRLITDITQSNWSDEIDSGKEMCRTIYYTTNFKNRIGPKKSSTVEKQVLLEGSRKNYIYYIESTVRTMGIPMADLFSIVFRYCILYINPNRTRFKISMKIVYEKSVFFATKSIIDSSVKSGCIDYHKDLKQALLRESQKMNINSSEQTVYCPQISIEDTYHVPVMDSERINLLKSNVTNYDNESKISWMMMVIICCISFFLLYLFKEIYSDSSLFFEINNGRSIRKEFDQDSLTEIMKIIKEMKNTIDILKLNIEILNKTQNCP